MLTVPVHDAGLETGLTQERQEGERLRERVSTVGTIFAHIQAASLHTLSRLQSCTCYSMLVHVVSLGLKS